MGSIELMDQLDGLTVRVIAGSARGRRLIAPEGEVTRPTGDRVRESLFNMLYSMGLPDQISVLDLFAGSGALGIEALSRGAAHATFVDIDRRAIDAINHNLSATGFTAQATVESVTAERVIDQAITAGHRWGLALLDPPYAFDDWDLLLAKLPADAVVIESDRAIVAPPNWEVMRQRQYGTTIVVVLGSNLSAGRPTGMTPLE